MSDAKGVILLWVEKKNEMKLRNYLRNKVGIIADFMGSRRRFLFFYCSLFTADCCLFHSRSLGCMKGPSPFIFIPQAAACPPQRSAPSGRSLAGFLTVARSDTRNPEFRKMQPRIFRTACLLCRHAEPPSEG